MIPRVLHYCWFGGKRLPSLARQCIESWHKFCPDFEIVEWNERNFDFSQSQYLEWCIENRKWAFASDLVRLLVVEKYGGVYFDTDVLLLRPLSQLMDNEAFYAFESPDFVATGLGFGAVPAHVTVKAMIEEYNKLSKNKDGNWPTVNCPRLNTAALCQLGLVANGKRQNVCGAEIYPVDWFNPFDCVTGRYAPSVNTMSIHRYAMSWLPWHLRLRNRFGRLLKSKL